jgi:hypothetical protein
LEVGVGVGWVTLFMASIVTVRHCCPVAMRDNDLAQIDCTFRKM